MFARKLMHHRSSVPRRIALAMHGSGLALGLACGEATPGASSGDTNAKPDTEETAESEAAGDVHGDGQDTSGEATGGGQDSGTGNSNTEASSETADPDEDNSTSLSGSDSEIGDDSGSEDTGTDPHSYDNDCQRVISAALVFFNGQRCGDAQNYLLRDNPNGPACHVDDGEARGRALGGGWHDDGGHLKFTVTNAATAYQLLKAYQTFPKSFKDFDDYSHSEQANGIPDVLDEARHGLDYLAKLLDGASFVQRIGVNESLSWATSPYDWKVLKTERAVLQQGQADLAGLSAAALALAANLYEDFDPERARTYAEAASAQHDFALAHPQITQDAYYEDPTWKDSVLCSAVELYRLDGDTDERARAQAYSTELGQLAWVPDWSNPTDLCRHSLFETGDQPALDLLMQAVDDHYIPLISTDPEVAGLAHIDAWGTLRYANAAAFAAGLAWHASDDADARARYAAFTASQVEFMLGDNPYDRSFIVGVGRNPPTEPIHRNAYGLDNVILQAGDKPKYTHLGALVGGPDMEDGYEDRIDNWASNEVAIHYNAALVGALAALASMDLAGQFAGKNHCAGFHDNL